MLEKLPVFKNILTNAYEFSNIFKDNEPSQFSAKNYAQF